MIKRNRKREMKNKEKTEEMGETIEKLVKAKGPGGRSETRLKGIKKQNEVIRQVGRAVRDRDRQQKEIKENRPSGKKIDVSKTRWREILR